MPTQSKRKSGRSTRSEGRTSRSNMDAVSLLKKDHTEVRALLKKLESSAEDGGDEAKELLEKLETEVTAHTTIEEEIFYPAFRDALESEDDEHLYFEALEEHHMVDIAMEEIKDLDAYGPEFAAKAKV